MDALLVATGFTGALTLVWLARCIHRKLLGPACASVCFGESGIDAVVRALGSARREIILCADLLRCRPAAQALVDARLRGAQVEVLLAASEEADPSSEWHFLVAQGLTPLLVEGTLGPGYLLVDGKTLILLPVGLGQEPTVGHTLVVRGQTELVSAFAQEFTTRRSAARNGQAKPAPDDLLAAVARGSLEVDPPAKEEQSIPATPIVTAATAELFARLRQETAVQDESADKAA